MESTNKFKNLVNKVSKQVSQFFKGFSEGNAITKGSFFVMGLGQLLRGQIFKGSLYLVTQLMFIYFMITSGVSNIIGLKDLGSKMQERVWDEARGIFVVAKGDNSMLMLLFGVATIFIIIAFIITYIMSVHGSIQNEKLLIAGKKPNNLKKDIQLYLNDKYHVTVLTLPVFLTFLFTIVPLVFMILIAFTNFDRNHQPPGNLFTWVGVENFTAVLWNDPLKSKTFIELLIWTLTWAVLATGLNYIFGMVLALMINKKGIKIKKFWRTIFVVTIAVPQFVSLLLMSQLLADLGTLNVFLREIGLIEKFLPFLSDPTWAKVTVIIVNLWVDRAHIIV